MEQSTWILLIYALGLTAMMVELFIPEFIVGTIGFVMVVGSVIFAVVTDHYMLAGIQVSVAVAFFPLFFLMWKNVLSRVLSSPETLRDFRSSSDRYEQLLGKEGNAMSSLRPSGSAFIEDGKYNVVTRGEMIDKGTRVKVIDVAGSRLVVKRAGGKSSPEKNGSDA